MLRCTGGAVWSTARRAIRSSRRSSTKSRRWVLPVRIQLEHQREPWPEGAAIRVRIGVHVGEVEETSAGLVGLAIHHAARIAAAFAVAAAAERAGHQADGVWFIDLAPVRDESAVANTVAEALGVHGTEKELLDAIAERSMLLVFDNCEHLLDSSARLIATLLETGPRLQVLATSRQPLAVSGEVVYRVPTLSNPRQRPSHRGACQRRWTLVHRSGVARRCQLSADRR